MTDFAIKIRSAFESGRLSGAMKRRAVDMYSHDVLFDRNLLPKEFQEARSRSDAEVARYCEPFQELIREAAAVLSGLQQKDLAISVDDGLSCCLMDGVTYRLVLRPMRPMLYVHVEYEGGLLHVLRNLGRMEIESPYFVTVGRPPFWRNFWSSSGTARQLLALQKELTSLAHHVGERARFYGRGTEKGGTGKGGTGKGDIHH